MTCTVILEQGGAPPRTDTVFSLQSGSTDRCAVLKGRSVKVTYSWDGGRTIPTNKRENGSDVQNFEKQKREMAGTLKVRRYTSIIRCNQRYVISHFCLVHISRGPGGCSEVHNHLSRLQSLSFTLSTPGPQTASFPSAGKTAFSFSSFCHELQELCEVTFRIRISAPNRHHSFFILESRPGSTQPGCVVQLHIDY